MAIAALAVAVDSGRFRLSRSAGGRRGAASAACRSPLRLLSWPPDAHPAARSALVLAAALRRRAGSAGGAARQAQAYPQWQFSRGSARCNQCHYAPGGGGLINSYGRDADGELSSFGGEGEFLHGAVQLPAWLALGGDLRGGFVDQDVQDPDGNAVAVFPMQADLAARVALPLGLSVSGILGLRGQFGIRSARAVSELPAHLDSRLISREHY